MVLVVLVLVVRLRLLVRRREVDGGKFLR